MIPDLMLNSSSSSIFIPTPTPEPPISSSLLDDDDDGFGQFLDTKDDLDEGFGDFKFDENEEIPPPSTTKSKTSEDNTPRSPQNTPQFDNDLGSSSGEEEVLEVGTF